MARKPIGFEVAIDPDTPYSVFRAARHNSWTHHGVPLWNRAEFGASPIRDKKSRDEYTARLAYYGVEYTVKPIYRQGNKT